MFRSMKTQDRKRGPYAKSAQRRRQIIEAAFDVFAARGYQGGSLQEVADRVGLGHTSILHYFPSKRALLIAVLEQRDAVAKPQPSEAPQGLVEVVLAQAMHNQTIPGLIELYTVLCGEAVTEGYPARDYFVDRFSRLRASYARRLRELEARGTAPTRCRRGPCGGVPGRPLGRHPGAVAARSRHRRRGRLPG